MIMRRALIAFLVVLLLISVGFLSVHGLLLEIADDVTVTQQTLFGDPTAASGVEVLVRNHYDQHLLWETTLKLEEVPVLKTDFTFQNAPIIIPKDPAYPGLEFTSVRDAFFFTGNRISEAVASKYKPLLDALKDMEASVPKGEKKSFQINFADYLDYYPLEGQVILGEWSTVFSEFQHWTNDSEEIAAAINQFFRIPIQGRYVIDYEIDKTNNGSSYGAYIEIDHYPAAHGFATENACYFTFNSVLKDGNVFDTSLIPGGYGIYCLPYEGDQLKLNDLKMVFSLDPTVSYADMHLSRDGKRLRLHTWEGDDLMLTVIDIATMKQVQKVKLLTRQEGWTYRWNCYDNFTMIQEYASDTNVQDRITVWEENKDNTWSHVFTVDMDLSIISEGKKSNLFDSYRNAVDYQDGKLVLIAHQVIRHEPYWYRDYCDIIMVVFDQTGMCYAGTYHWNLTDVNSLEPNETRIHPTTDSALEVSW